jgi:hypothetical protein
VEAGIPMAGADFNLLEIDFEDVPVLELAKYRTLVQEIPAPTDGQIADFATFVSEAKSWYKHLPPFALGAPFYFFVDPCAGLDRVRLPGGTAAFFERTEGTEPFHHSWMTTETYQARFGCLSFCCERGSELFRPVAVPLDDGTEVKGFLDNNPSHPIIYPMADQPFRIPKQVLEPGRAEITGVVHRLAATVWFWQRVFLDASHDVTWPEETGGPSIVTRIRERCVAIGDDSHTAIAGAPDPKIEVLVRPERERMQMEMVFAMRRMRHLVFAGA